MSLSPKLKQGFLREAKISAGLTRFLINLWPPFIGAGIRVEQIADDWSAAQVRMRLRFYNRNIFGTHFGGSMFAMTDPFFALLIMHRLGTDYVVWDRASHIDYKLPAKGTVRARFEMDEAAVETARARTAGDQKYEPVFKVDIVDQQGQVVATVSKTLYIRRKPRGPKPPASEG